MQFRTVTADDIDDVAALWAANDLGAGNEVDAAEIAERLREEDGYFVLGAVDGATVAVAMGCYDNHRGWLKRVAVDPVQHGRGLGRQLIAEVERRFIANGVTKLRLAVWGDNTTAAEFWDALDYTELTEIRYFSKDLIGDSDDGC